MFRNTFQATAKPVLIGTGGSRRDDHDLLIMMS